MSEQMFNISSRFPAKMALLLDFGDWDGSCTCLLMRYGFCFFCLLSASAQNMYSATIAAADLCPFYGENLSYSRRAVAKMAKQQPTPSLSPRLRHYGGYSRVPRRLLWRKIRTMVAAPVLPAVHFGDNFRNCVNFNDNCNTVFASDIEYVLL